MTATDEGHSAWAIAETRDEIEPPKPASIECLERQEFDLVAIARATTRAPIGQTRCEAAPFPKCAF